MAPNDDEGTRIIRTWQNDNCLTGESMYQTEDGRVWKSTTHTPTMTGVTYGTVRGGRIHPRGR